MSMSDDGRSSGGTRNATMHAQADSHNSRSAQAPQRRSTLGGGAPTGLNGAMFGGGAARMPGHKPAGHVSHPAPQPAASQRDADPFGLAGSDPYISDPFGLGNGNLDDSLTLDDDFSKFEASYAPSEPPMRSYQASAYQNAEDDGDDASLGYDDQADGEHTAYADDGYDSGSEYKPGSFDYYGNASGQNEGDYQDDAFTLEGKPDEESEGDYLALGGEQDAGFEEDGYRHPRDVYAASTDLDEQPFDLAESEYDSSYNEGYQTPEDEIDAYIARAQRAVEQAPPRPQARANINAQGQSRARQARGTAVQAFDAPYDQKRPEIPLTGFSASRTKGPQRRQAEQAHDHEETDFEGDVAQGWKSKFQLKRGMVMVASAAACVVVLGGALAFAYRSGNSDAASGETPIVEADSRPIKVAPEDGGPQQSASGNKLIYDRLGSDNEQAAAAPEQVVPRQEEVDLSSLNGLNGQAQPAAAQPAADGGALGGVEQPALPGVAEGVQPMPGAESEPAAQQAADPNGPRRVATYVVRPDGTVVQPEEPAAAQVPAAPENVAAIPQGAAAAPAQAAAAGGGDQFVVQVGARKSQEEALAAFADLQQRYPQLLSGYRPMVQKADLGDKGTWFRLRVGPMPQKTAAAKLCDDLKGAGLPSCLVMTE